MEERPYKVNTADTDMLNATCLHPLLDVKVDWERVLVPVELAEYRVMNETNIFGDNSAKRSILSRSERIGPASLSCQPTCCMRYVEHARVFDCRILQHVVIF